MQGRGRLMHERFARSLEENAQHVILEVAVGLFMRVRIQQLQTWHHLRIIHAVVVVAQGG